MKAIIHHHCSGNCNECHARKLLRCGSVRQLLAKLFLCPDWRW